MPPQKLREVFGDFLRFAGHLGPDARMIGVFPETVGIGAFGIEANLRFKCFQHVKALVNGDRRELDDWVTFGVRSPDFKVDEDEFLIHGRSCHESERYSNWLTT